jgi:hypothetical protein
MEAVETKKILIALIAGLLLAQNAFALQEVAGPLVITVPIGGSNSSLFGLLNDGSETINVSLRAEGNVSDYLSFPTTVELPPKKFVYTNITATIPADYDKTGNITGYLYALQEGKPGQVKINIQMMKSVTITVLGQPKVLEQTSNSNQTSQTTQTSIVQTSPATGFVALISENTAIIALVIALLVIAFMFFEIQKLKKNQKEPSRRGGITNQHAPRGLLRKK